MTGTHTAGTPPLRRVLFGFLPMAVMAGVLFGSAGRWDLPAGWALIGLWAAAGLVGTFVVHKKDPTLWQERLRPGPGGKDPHLRRVAAPFFLLHFVVAGLDVGRFHWSGDVPAVAQLAGLVGVALALTVVVWAMAVNRFFSSDARIQRDRSHHLVTAGPYRYIRHPAYAAVLVSAASGPLALGSYWSALPLLPAALMILRRTRLEDSLLCEELEGYADYAQQVQYRLVPRLW